MATNLPTGATHASPLPAAAEQALRLHGFNPEDGVFVCRRVSEGPPNAPASETRCNLCGVWVWRSRRRKDRMVSICYQCAGLEPDRADE